MGEESTDPDPRKPGVSPFGSFAIQFEVPLRSSPALLDAVFDLRIGSRQKTAGPADPPSDFSRTRLDGVTRT